jgi:hypothetical protein
VNTFIIIVVVVLRQEGKSGQRAETCALQEALSELWAAIVWTRLLGSETLGQARIARATSRLMCYPSAVEYWMDVRSL